jgi:hypothetical protein
MSLHHATDAFVRTSLCLTVAAVVTTFIYLPTLSMPEGDATETEAEPGAVFEFGVYTDDGFVPATRVPLTVGTTFGWRLYLGDCDGDGPAVDFVEVLRAPTAPREWLGSGFDVSDDGTTSTLRDTVWPVDGVIENAWVVTEGDPAGVHEVRVTVGDLEFSAQFLLR